MGVGVMMEPRILTNSEDWLDDYERERAHELVSRFRRWASKNADALNWIYRHVEWLTRIQRRSSMKRVFEEARWESGIRLTEVDGNIRLSNDFTALMARIVLKTNPATAHVFTFRPSIFDLLEPEEIPRFDYLGRLVWDDAE